jgi:5,10-methylenetetrahydromethanopterin reductase
VKFDVAILATEPLPDVVRQVQLAERLGYDTAWITDSHLVCRELWVTLAACAVATSRIRLGPGVTVPHSRHVSVTASAIATLHDLAPGRVVLGIGTGGSSAQTMGLSLAQVGKVATLERTAIALRRLLAGETARFETGIDGRLAWLEGPRAIPIYLAGSGPRMLETAGRLGDGAIVYATVTPEVLRVALARVADGARAAGRAPEDLDVALWAPMSIGRDRGRARDHARGRVASACRHPLPVRLSDEDEAAMARVRESYDAYQHATAASAHRTLVPDRLVDLMALAGTPEDVAAQVARLAGVPGLRRVIAFPQAPGAGFAAREEILGLFAEVASRQPRVDRKAGEPR